MSALATTYTCEHCGAPFGYYAVGYFKHLYLEHAWRPEQPENNPAALNGPLPGFSKLAPPKPANLLMCPKCKAPGLRPSSTPVKQNASNANGRNPGQPGSTGTGPPVLMRLTARIGAQTPCHSTST